MFQRPLHHNSLHVPPPYDQMVCALLAVKRRKSRPGCYSTMNQSLHAPSHNTAGKASAKDALTCATAATCTFTRRGGGQGAGGPEGIRAHLGGGGGGLCGGEGGGLFFGGGGGAATQSYVPLWHI